MSSIVQINTSRGGIPKYSVPVATVGPLGIEGDSYAHPQIHGGPIQALLLICLESLDELISKGYPVFPGTLGENLTTQGLDRKEMRLGQLYRIGEVVIELTKIRAPCNTLNVYGPNIKREIYDAQVKSGDHTSPRWGLSGFYAAVRQGGIIHRHDTIES